MEINETNRQKKSVEQTAAEEDDKESRVHKAAVQEGTTVSTKDNIIV